MAEQERVPTLSLPTGGGAVRGLGEKFTANPARGTGALTVPVPVSPARSGFGPALALTYDSAAGNGPFGAGWDVALPHVSVRTENGLPRYGEGTADDLAPADVMVLSGAEELVPARRPVAGGPPGATEPVDDLVDGHRVTRFRPRTEGAFDRIERWARVGHEADVHWRTVTRENVTTLFGTDDGSRVRDPHHPGRIARWLIAASHDDRGNTIEYEYRSEDLAGVDLGRASESHRDGVTVGAQRYPAAVRYGNRVSHLDPAPTTPDGWLFEVVFDYGDGYAVPVPPDPAVPADGQHHLLRASTSPVRDWAVRPDPFSSYRFGFEVRTYRRCSRILLFHRVPELGDAPVLVASTELGYADRATDPGGPDVTGDLAHQGSTAFGSFLTSVTQHGHRPGPDGTTLQVSRPPLRMRYGRPQFDTTVRTLDPASAENLPVGLADPVRWVDLDGDGMCGALVESAGAWWYRRNEGDGVLAPLEMVASRPAGGLAGRQLVDLDGNGALDLVDLTGPVPGSYERIAGEGWSAHRPFTALSANVVSDPGLRFTDLDGDGGADALHTDADHVTWYPALGTAGYGPPRRVPWPPDRTDSGPAGSDDARGSIHLADMSGDGLADRVEIGNGTVRYRPHLGHGRFGQVVTMDDGPLFDHGDQFDPRRLLLVDIDGNGFTDIVYVGSRGTHAYLNRAGNGWSAPVAVTGVPSADTATQLTAVDLLGAGTACLVWSSPLAEHAAAPVRYVDLMGGTKPHLLVETDNDLGARTVLRYAPSTRFWSADHKAGRPWATRLPFPLQVVEEVETTDRVSGNRLVTRYTYHHGHYDGIDREFRGFGRVDRWDTDHPHTDGPPLPSTLTRSWFHTGVHVGGESLSRHLAAEYHQTGEGPWALPDTTVPPGLDPADEREACRALRGTLLREETYALDGSDREWQPYAMSEHAVAAQQVQPRAGTYPAVFVVHPRESLARRDERDADDPRVTHELTLEVDAYAQVTRSARIAYGRRAPDASLPEPSRSAQMTTLATTTEHQYTDAIDDATCHRLPMPWRTTTVELRGLPGLGDAAGSAGTVPMTVDRVRDLVAAGTDGRVVSAEVVRYRRDDLDGPAADGTAHRQGLVHETYRLAFTAELLDAAYRRDGADLLSDRDAALATAGYVDLDGDGCWWARSGRTFLHPDPSATPAQEHAHARRHFFLPVRYRSPFPTGSGPAAPDPVAPADTVVHHDPHDLLVVRTTDPVGNTTSVEIDYRTLTPRRLVDPNGCSSEVAYDALGLVVATAVRGRGSGGSAPGDSLDGVTADLTPARVRAAFDDPGADPHGLLGSATTRLVYDLGAPARTRDAEQPDPVGVCTLSRETHVSDSPGPTGRVRCEFSFSDGFGREVLHLAPAVPAADGTPRWVRSGHVEYDGRARVVGEYEPAFADTHRPELGRRTGVSRTRCHDPLDRVVAVLHPNGTWEKTAFDAWGEQVHDVNDTVTADPRTDPDVGPIVTALLAGRPPWTGWYEARAAGALGPAEADAAAKAAAHAATPVGRYVDALGHPVCSRADLGLDAGGAPVHRDTQWVLDLSGEQRRVVDALGRVAADHELDLLGRRVRTTGMDSGTRRVLPDAAGEPVRGWDDRGHEYRILRDALRRPVGRTVRGHDPLRSDPDTLAGPVLVEQTVYGESVADPEDRHLRTRVHQHRDGAGTVTTSYDFRGNVTRTAREVPAGFEAAIDWAQPPQAGERFVATAWFDALNRPVQVVPPHADRVDALRTVVRTGYDESGRPARLDVWLDRPDDPAGLLDPALEPPSPVGVTAIERDAHGRRTRAAHRNGVETRYRYDDATFRLVGIETGDGPDLRQDVRFTHDPVGNVTRIHDGAHQPVFFRNRVVDPTVDLHYDPGYQLVRATGREQLGQGGLRVPHSPDDAARRGVVHPGDGDALGTYCETYSYDALGNLTAMRHRESCPGAESWSRSFTYTETSGLEGGRTGNRLTSTAVGATTEVVSTGGDGYDAHGNTLRLPHLPEMRWDHADRLRTTRRQAVTGPAGAPDGERTHYVYDASGERVRKVTVTAAGAVREERIYLGAGVELYRRHIGPAAGLERETLHLSDEEQRLALVETRRGADDGTPVRVVRYQYGDHLGSARLELDDQARVVSYTEYTPYGSTSYQATPAGPGAAPKRYGFTGKERDEESGLTYHGARYYAPWLGRWTAADPLELRDSPNVYLYAQANPIVAKDPTGGPVWLVPLLIYLGYRALESAAETGVEAGIAKATGDQTFDVGTTFAKNMGVNTVLGVIPGAPEGKIAAKAARYSIQLGVRTMGDATVDTLQGKGDFSTNLVKSGAGNLAGDALGAVAKKGIGKLTTSLSPGKTSGTVTDTLSGSGTSAIAKQVDAGAALSDAARKALRSAQENTATVAADSLGRVGQAKTRRGFRDAVASILRKDENHPLRFLLGENDKLRNAKGTTADVWIDRPELIEAGHVVSAKTLTDAKAGSDRFAVMSIWWNRTISASVEHPGKAGASLGGSHVLSIGGIPVDASTAADWVAKGLLDAKLLAQAATVTF